MHDVWRPRTDLGLGRLYSGNGFATGWTQLSMFGWVQNSVGRVPGAASKGGKAKVTRCGKMRVNKKAGGALAWAEGWDHR